MRKANDLLEIVKQIRSAKNIVLTTHIMPDTDGIGAILALKEMIFQMEQIDEKPIEKKIRIIIDDDIPQKLNFLKGSENIEKFELIDEEKVDLIIALDVSVIPRLGRIKKYKKSIKILNIDHHISSEMFGDYNYIDTSAVSTTDIIYDFIEKLGIEMSKEQAEDIYVGILNDTNNFTYSNVTNELLLKVEKLIEKGIDSEEIFYNFYLKKSESELKIYKKAREKSVIIESLKFIYTFITIKEINEYNGNKFDTEGISDHLLVNSSCIVSLFLVEQQDGKMRGSMRTTLENLDLNEIVSPFNGGGHKKAVGFSTNLAIEEIINRIKAKLEKRLLINNKI